MRELSDLLKWYYFLHVKPHTWGGFYERIREARREGSQVVSSRRSGGVVLPADAR